MSDLIDRQAAIDVVHRAIYGFFDICSDDDESPITYKDEKLLDINKAITTQICKLPSAQPERKKGRWISQDFNKHNGMISTLVYYFPKCSVCGHTANYTNYCPNCGADMRGEDDATLH